MAQDKVMVYDPATGANRPYPSHAQQWRQWHGGAAWLFNPWTGLKRDARDVGSDVYGHAIADGSEKFTGYATTGAVLGGVGAGLAVRPQTALQGQNQCEQKRADVTFQRGTTLHVHP